MVYVTLEFHFQSSTTNRKSNNNLGYYGPCISKLIFQKQNLTYTFLLIYEKHKGQIKTWK